MQQLSCEKDQKDKLRVVCIALSQPNAAPMFSTA